MEVGGGREVEEGRGRWREVGGSTVLRYARSRSCWSSRWTHRGAPGNCKRSRVQSQRRYSTPGATSARYRYSSTRGGPGRRRGEGGEKEENMGRRKERRG